MKLIFSSRCLLIGLLVLVGGETISAQTKETAFIGWIPVQNFTGGKKVELDLTRFVTLPAGAKLEVERPLPLDQVKLQLESSECILRILPEPGAQGMEDFVLGIRPRQGDPLEGVFSYCIQSIPETKFRYLGAGSEKSVFVAGSFNGWKKGATPLRRTGQKTWEASLDLPPGSHT